MEVIKPESSKYRVKTTDLYKLLTSGHFDLTLDMKLFLASKVPVTIQRYYYPDLAGFKDEEYINLLLLKSTIIKHARHVDRDEKGATRVVEEIPCTCPVEGAIMYTPENNLHDAYITLTQPQVDFLHSLERPHGFIQGARVEKYLHDQREKRDKNDKCVII